MTTEFAKVEQRETALIRSFGGLQHIKEANESLNDLQRKKIHAIYKDYGKAYIGKINFYDAARENLSTDSVYVEYTGQLVYNFEASFVVPEPDNALAELIVRWNTKGQVSLLLIEQMTNRIHAIGGANLLWS